MGIVTKTGDKGSTSLVGGQRIAKTDIQVETYGTLDELNCHISVAQKASLVASSVQLLEAIQYQLFYLGAELASPNATLATPGQQHITNDDIIALEQAIDQAMSQVPVQHSFVLPGSSLAGSQLHLARAVARRAERRVIALHATCPLREAVMRYLNRLSDALYALARLEDYEQQTQHLITEVITRYQACENEAALTDISDNATQRSLKVLHLAINEAHTIGIAIVFALLDAHANTILTYRMPGALLVSEQLASKKAYTAIALKMPTHELQPQTQPGSPLFQIEASCADKLVSFGGGYPIWHNGQLIGGIGISGGSVEQDMQIAQAALKGI